MVSTGEIKRGMTIELDGTLYQIVEFQHIKMGRGSAPVRMKLRNVRRGDLIEKTFQAGRCLPTGRAADRAVPENVHRGDTTAVPGHKKLEAAAAHPATARPR